MSDTQSGFLDQLEGWVRELIVIAREDLASQTEAALTQRPGEKRWNALECMAHLNAYADMYLPRFEQAVHKAKANKMAPGATAEIGWFGGYCVRSVSPERRTKGKMRSPKKHNYLNKDVTVGEIKKFITYQEMLLRIIAKCRDVDINKPKVSFHSLPFLKMNLGGFLQFVIMHQRRHMVQAQEAVGIYV